MRNIIAFEGKIQIDVAAILQADAAFKPRFEIEDATRGLAVINSAMVVT